MSFILFLLYREKPELMRIQPQSAYLQYIIIIIMHYSDLSTPVVYSNIIKYLIFRRPTDCCTRVCYILFIRIFRSRSKTYVIGVVIIITAIIFLKFARGIEYNIIDCVLCTAQASNKIN